MRKKNIFHLYAVLLLTAILMLGVNTAFAGPQCSGCHPSMADNPMKLPKAAPADLLLALQTPCFNYARVLEEYYYIEELFVTIEHHLVDLEHDRYHMEPQFIELETSRDLYREVKKMPITSLEAFVQQTGKLRFDVGKVYRVAKEKRIDQHNRNVFGIMILGFFFVLFLIVSGWRVASGRGVVHKPRTTLGYDDLMEQGMETVLEPEEKQEKTE